MHMVGHQAIGPDLYLAAVAPFGHQVEILPVITFRKEGLQAAIAALRDVVGDAGDNDSCYACHDKKAISDMIDLSIIKYGVPGITDALLYPTYRLQGSLCD